jgi:O-antigen/teichoic acid export membrane protein
MTKPPPAQQTDASQEATKGERLRSRVAQHGAIGSAARPLRALFGERSDTPTLRSNLSATVLTQILVGVGGLVLYRLLALNKGAPGVASYALVKQMVVFASPTVMLGLATAIPRYVARSHPAGHGPERYLLAGAALTALTTMLVGVLALVSPRATASLLFGDVRRTNLVVPLVATLAGAVAFDVTAGYLRGRFRFRIYSAMTAISVAGLPVVLLLVLPRAPIGTLILLMGFAMLAPCVAVAAWPIAHAVRSATIRGTVKAGHTLLSFGYRRVPGELAAIGLFALPLVLAAHFESLHRVAYLTVGLYVVSVVVIAFQPLGLVLLPLLSKLCATNPAAARQHVARLCASGLHISLFLAPQLVLFADVAARAWLGADFAKAGPIIRITTFPLVLFMVHLILRTSLDAVSVKAYNSRNSIIALAILAGSSAILLASTATEPLTAIAWSFAIGLLSLGALTFATVQRLFSVLASDFALRAALPLAAATAGAGYLLRETVVGSDASLLSVFLIAMAELLLAAAYVAGLLRAGVAWPSEVRTRLLRRPA